MDTEKLILSALLNREEFTRAVSPHIKEEYFQDKTTQIVCETILDYFRRYNSLPSKEAVMIECGNRKNITEDQATAINDVVKSLVNVEDNEYWLIEKAETFCKERAVFNALMQSVKIVDGKDTQFTSDAIPTILQQALSVCFDNSVGHDYFTDAAARFEYYHRKENKIPTNLDIFNKVMRGGPSRKTFNVILAPPHAGKTLMMVNFAIGAINAGYNVLYITMEMAEEEISKRFDINMMNVDFDTIEKMSKDIFTNKFAKVMEKAKGKLMIKEYPTSGAHAGHFKTLIQELKMKQNFVPDMIVVDYLNICLSQRYKAGSAANSYTIVKSIGEELRALAIETNTVIWSATQTTRTGIGNSDVDMTNTSESIGIPAIADFFVALIDSEELRAMNQMIAKQLKNRYDDKNKKEKFAFGIDRSHMKLYDLEDSAQDGIHQQSSTSDNIRAAVADVEKKSRAKKPDTTPPWEGDSEFSIPKISVKPKSDFNGFNF
ncbi:DNA primase/helicase [Synechococcus phage BUCT-ZZ01]|nr:DNA primase/helicase [Synechococcus phage BUCT-ZZ01]